MTDLDVEHAVKWALAATQIRRVFLASSDTVRLSDTLRWRVTLLAQGWFLNALGGFGTLS